MQQQLKRTWNKKIRPIVVDGSCARITLSDGSIALIDTQDISIVSSWNWTAKSKDGKVYAMRGAGKKSIKLPNEITPPPPGFLVDHRNGDTLDNRRSNLRHATIAQNCQNRRVGRANKSGFKGVSFRSDRGTWLAAIRSGNILVKLGTFKTAEAAARTYDAAALKTFGEFAVLNFPIVGKFDAEAAA